MDKISCLICLNEPDRFFYKGATMYSQCANCKTVFCDILEQEGLVGGEYEEERNKKQNHLRIDRIKQMTGFIPQEEVRILDWGCGHGYLIEDLKKEGYVHVDGYDAYFEKYQQLPKKNEYHVISLIETAEHFSKPYREFDYMLKCLMQNGCVMIETGFVEIPEQEGQDIEDYFYINPNAGHSTIFSHHGLDLLMALKGFTPRQHFNRHVRLYQKLAK